MMETKLPESIWSPEDLAELIADLRRYGQWLSAYEVKQRVSANAPSTNPPTIAPAAIQCLQTLRAQNHLNQAGLEALIAAIEAEQKSAPQISFTLAGPPSNGLKKRLVAWCREAIAPNILVSFQFNATILGGMIVRYGSHIFDWSFRRQILAKRENFAEVLRNV